MTGEQRERLGAAKTEEWGVFPDDIAAIRAALADVDDLANALEYAVNAHGCGPGLGKCDAPWCLNARAALRQAGQL